MRKHICIVLSLVSLFLSVFAGCNPSPQKKFSRELVRTYAGLLQLHEKEKILGNTPDSLYQLKVRDFFAARKIDEVGFQKQVDEISRDDAAWKSFLLESTAAVDSLKAAKPL